MAKQMDEATLKHIMNSMVTNNRQIAGMLVPFDQAADNFCKRFDCMACV
jgi:hypothetical protein